MRGYENSNGGCAEAKHELAVVEWKLAMVVHLRLGVTHDVLACWFGGRSFPPHHTRKRPSAALLAERGCTITPGQRLHRLAEVVDYLGANERTKSSAGPKSECAARLRDARTGGSSSPGGKSRTP